jgi:hypothetical protein
VPHQRPRIDIPDHGNLVTILVKLGRFCGTPVRRDLRKFADNERLDVRPPGLFVVKVGADVSNVRVSQTNNLPGITGVGENFLVTGEAGVENNFSAAARDGAGGAAIKDAPVFQREGRGSVLNFGQWGLP